MTSWGRGTYDQRAGGSAVGQVLAEMAEKARVREEQQRQAEALRQRQTHEMDLNERRIKAEVTAAYIRNPNEQTYAAVSAVLGNEPLSPYQPTDQEQFGRSFWGDLRRADPTKPLQVDPVRAGLVNPNLASAAPWMATAGQRYTYGQPQGALPPQVAQAQEVADDLRMSAPEADTSKLAWDKRSRIEVPESAATVQNRRAQTGLFGAQTGLVGAQTGMVGAQTQNEALKRDPSSVLSPGFVKRTTNPANTQQEKQADLASQALGVIGVMEKHPGFKGAVGAKGPMSLWGLKDKPAAGSQAADFVGEYERLRAILTFDNLQLMRGLGHMSDKEFQVVQTSAAALDRNLRNETGFANELERIKPILKKVSERAAATPGGAGGSDAGTRRTPDGKTWRKVAGGWEEVQ